MEADVVPHILECVGECVTGRCTIKQEGEEGVSEKGRLSTTSREDDKG